MVWKRHTWRALCTTNTGQTARVIYNHHAKSHAIRLATTKTNRNENCSNSRSIELFFPPGRMSRLTNIALDLKALNSSHTCVHECINFLETRDGPDRRTGTNLALKEKQAKENKGMCPTIAPAINQLKRRQCWTSYRSL